MQYTMECATPFEVLQVKADVAARGYRYCSIGLIVYYWSE